MAVWRLFLSTGYAWKKLVSDFLRMKNESIGKANAIVVFGNSEVMWLEGRRISEKFKVEKNSSLF